MTTVTLQTDEALLAKVTEELARRQLTLDEFLDQTLRQVADDAERMERFDAAIKSLQRFDFGGPYTRDEMNER